MVYDSFDYDLAIDHALVVHLSQTAKKLGISADPSLKAHEALYYYKVKGYLTAVDLLREVSTSSSG